MFRCSSSSIIVFRFFFFSIGSSPVLYDDLFLLRPQVYRNSASQCLIELVDIVASDIVLALGDELSLHDV